MMNSLDVEIKILEALRDSHYRMMGRAERYGYDMMMVAYQDEIAELDKKIQAKYELRSMHENRFRGKIARVKLNKEQ